MRTKMRQLKDLATSFNFALLCTSCLSHIVLRLRHGDSGLGFVQRKLSTERKEFQITDSFMPVDVDGAYDRVCRGIDPFDDDGSYYIVRGEAAAESLSHVREHVWTLQAVVA